MTFQAFRLATATGAISTALLLLLAMHFVAANITAGSMRSQARQQLATLQAGRPLWQWRLRDKNDLVAGRVFGQAKLAADSHGLGIASLDGTPFELGLPLNTPVDLAHWPLLRLRFDIDGDARLGLIVANSNQPACLVSEAARLVAGQTEASIDLRRLDWQSERGQPCTPPATLSYLLRLKWLLPAGGSIRLHDAMLASEPPPMPAAGGDVELPAGLAPARKLLDEQGPLPPVPRFRLSADDSAETLLALRDQIRRRWPAALIIPGTSTLTAAPARRPPLFTAWGLCALYGLILLGLAWHPPPDRHGALIEMAACMAGPLWLIAGLQWGQAGAGPAIAAFVGALLYAAWIGQRSRTDRAWRWLGAWQAWLGPLSLLPLALGLVLACGHAWLRPLPAHVLVYLGWAALQQWLMLTVVLGRLERALPGGPWAGLACATLFALLHTPNGLLMQLCLLAECWWSWCFWRSRSLLPIAVAHAGCALLLEAGLAGGSLRSLEVSARFFF